MNVNYSYSIILNLITNLHSHHSWCGETHIQKNMYLFQTLYNINNKFNFILYKHGPYSFDLHDIINELYVYNFIEPHSRYPYGPRIYLTELGRKFIDTVCFDDIRLDRIASIFGRETVQNLEKISTALMIKINNPDMDIKYRIEMLNKIKPHITQEEASKATAYLDSIKQILPDVII